MRGIGRIHDIDGVDVSGIFWPMRWNTRSAPVRSTRTAIPIFRLERLGQFLGDRQIGRGVVDDLASFFAASISAGVTGSGGGASANTRVENAAPARTAPVPLSTLRLESNSSCVSIACLP